MLEQMDCVGVDCYSKYHHCIDKWIHFLTSWSHGVHADLQEKQQLISWINVKDCSTSPQTVRGQEDKSNRPFQDIFITSMNMLSSLIL